MSNFHFTSCLGLEFPLEISLQFRVHWSGVCIMCGFSSEKDWVRAFCWHSISIHCTLLFELRLDIWRSLDWHLACGLCRVCVEFVLSIALSFVWNSLWLQLALVEIKAVLDSIRKRDLERRLKYVKVQVELVLRLVSVQMQLSLIMLSVWLWFSHNVGLKIAWCSTWDGNAIVVSSEQVWLFKFWLGIGFTLALTLLWAFLCLALNKNTRTAKFEIWIGI